VRNRTVLVIDDNADLTMLFQRFLAGHNVGVSSATSGRQAVERIHELRPALILLDLMLPHQDGWEILQQLRSAEQTATTPIIVCSVLNEPDLALAMGADDYITKPVSQETLVSALRRWLGTLHPAV
jgi:CheY-like chemotaxis protein